jgi:hypothetical protein
MKMLELMDARERRVRVGIVDDGSALEVGNVKHLALEIHRPMTSCRVGEQRSDETRAREFVARCTPIGPQSRVAHRCKTSYRKRRNFMMEATMLTIMRFPASMRDI